jgi:hypothetical protein
MEEYTIADGQFLNRLKNHLRECTKLLDTSTKTYPAATLESKQVQHEILVLLDEMKVHGLLHLSVLVLPDPVKEMKQYEVEPEAFWLGALLSGDDYAVINLAEKKGWEALGHWGRDSWTVGAWPYDILFHRDRERCYELVEWSEGGVTMYRCPSAELRNEITDVLALHYWKHWKNGPDVAVYDSIDQLPPGMRGPCPEE